MIRDDIYRVFRHFKIVGGQGLMPSNIFAMANSILKQYYNDQIVNEINNMEADNLLIANNNFITLTDQGEQLVWGKFILENGVNEFMDIFNHFNVKSEQILLTSNILAVKHDKLSPLSNKHLEEIINECIRLGFLQEGNECLILTETGFKYILGN